MQYPRVPPLAARQAPLFVPRPSVKHDKAAKRKRKGGHAFANVRTSDSVGGHRGAPSGRRTIRRYHPITDGFTQSYQVSFRFGQNESFRDVTRNAWRWAWNTLNPPVHYIDVEQMRRVLIDHLEAQATTIDGRTAIPFVISTLPTNQVQWNYTMVAMGFVGKNIECADQLLREGDRDQTERGQKMRQTGLAIISSLIQALPTVPLQGTGYDLATGKPWTGHIRSGSPLAAERHRRHARADAGLPARDAPSAASIRSGSTG